MSEESETLSALADLAALVESWQNGIFKRMGITWTADPPALQRARQLIAAQNQRTAEPGAAPTTKA